MQVLQGSLFFLRYVGICSDRTNEISGCFLRSYKSIFISFAIAQIFISSPAYMFIHHSSFERSTGAAVVLMAALASGGAFMTLGLKMKSVKLLHHVLQTIVERSK